MTAWSHLSTIFKQRYVLRIAGLLTLCVALITTQLFAIPAHAAPGVNQTLSFQGRLLTAAGGIVPDGHYNMQFKIYQDGTETGGGTLKWTENHINNGSNAGIEVKGGYFSVALGSVNAFGTQVDWNQDTLWLSMNVAGSANACSTFDSGACDADGEMLPMKRITSVPFAINSAQLGGKSAENFVQLAQGVQEDATTGVASIAIDKTGVAGEFLRLQSDGEDVMIVDSGGDIEFGSQPDHYISVATSATNESGGNLAIRSGSGGSGSGSSGGSLLLQGGDAGGTNGNGGNVWIDAGSGAGAGFEGEIALGAARARSIVIGNVWADNNQEILIGNNRAGGVSNVTIGASGDAAGGYTDIQSKDNTTITTDGVNRATFDTSGGLTLGNGISSNSPADFRIQGTSSSASGVSGGTLTIQGGGATTGDADGGNLVLSGGSASGNGAKGLVVIDTPTFAAASTQSSSSDVNVTQSNIDSFGIVTLNATSNGVDFTLGAPSLGANAAGRIIYVTAANGSYDFMLRANIGGGATVEKAVPMQQNTTTAMIWSGSVWTVVGSAGSGTLQSTYNNTTQAAGGSELVIANNTNSGSSAGLTIQESSTSPLSDALLEVKSASSGSLLTVNSNINEYAANGGAETSGSSSVTFPTDTWTAVAGSTITRYTAGKSNIAAGDASVKLTTTAGYQGTYNKLKAALQTNSYYNVSMKVKLESGTMTDFGVVYSPDGSAIQSCVDNLTVTTTGWTTISCTFQAPSSGINSSNGVIAGPTGSTPRTFYVDDLSVTQANTTSVATDGTASDSVNFSTNWVSTGTGSTVTRNTSDGQAGSDSAQAAITTGGSQRGVANKLANTTQSDKRYRVSAYVKQTSGSAFTDFAVRYSPNGGTTFTECADYNTQTVSSSWTQVTCTVSTGITYPSNPYVYFVANSSANRTFLVDSLAVTLTGNTTSNVQIGGQANDDTTTLFSLDKSSSAPVGGEAMLGSMYYDTTLGKVQCFEADGWGACGAAPDTFVSLTPEYAGAVMNGTATGTMTSDLCSDALNINDGSSAQPSICGTNETYNLYKWTSSEASAQAKSIYVTYQLPSNFKKFVDGSTSLLGKTDSSNSSVTYQVYRNTSSGLTACGSVVSVSTGSQTTWQKGTATGSADPSACSFAAGDSIVFKVSMSAQSNANAYASNLNFTYSNN